MFLVDSTEQEILKEILSGKLKRYESRILSSNLLGFEYFAQSGIFKFSIDFVEFLGYKNSIDMGVSSIEDIYKIIYRDDIDILIDEKVITPDMDAPLKAVVGLRKMIVRDFLEVDEDEIIRVLTASMGALKQFSPKVEAYLVNELGPVSAFLPEGSK